MHVELVNKQAFQEVLAHYQPAPESIDILRRIPLVILLGVSGSGRNTIINHLTKTGKYQYIISDTTRPPKVRDGKIEQHGINYYFRSEEDVLQDLREGKFLEAELIHNQQISGMNIRALAEVAESGKIPINEVDIGGTDNILKAKSDTQFFFIIPPSYTEWMRRLNAREVMTEKERNNRVSTAIRVIEKGLKEDHFTFVINDSSAASASKIDEQVRGPRDTGHHDEAREVARQILNDIKSHAARN